MIKPIYEDQIWNLICSSFFCQVSFFIVKIKASFSLMHTKVHTQHYLWLDLRVCGVSMDTSLVYAPIPCLLLAASWKV